MKVRHNSLDIPDESRASLDELVRQILSSAFVMVVHNGTIDAKVAIETGVAVLSGKPILLVVMGGAIPPPALAALAVQTIQVADMKAMELPLIQAKLHDAIAQMIRLHLEKQPS